MRRLLICLVFILLALPACNFHAKEVKQLTILSFNLRYDNQYDGEYAWEYRKDACANMLDEVTPSVFGIQEGLKHQVDFLSEKLSQYAHVGVGREDGDTLGEYCAVFFLKERFDLLENGNFWLSESPTQPSLGWDAACKRIVTWVKLYDKFAKQNIFLLNTHFDHVGMVARKESALLLMHQINNIADKRSRIFIIGDFNAEKKDALFIPIRKHYYNARVKAPRTDSCATFNDWGKSQGEQIDYIFFRGDKILEYKTINDNYGIPYLSDHYPVMAVFE